MPHYDESPDGQRTERERREAPRETGKRLATLKRRGSRSKPDSELRIVLDAYEGHPFLSLRIWEQGTDGNFYPTKSGVTLRIGEVYEAIRGLCVGAREMGVDLHPKGQPEPQGNGAAHG